MFRNQKREEVFLKEVTRFFGMIPRHLSW